MSAMAQELLRIQEGVKLAGHNLSYAAASDDVELLHAVLVNTLASLPSYLEALVGSDNA